jgi:hypothetical protein
LHKATALQAITGSSDLKIIRGPRFALYQPTSWLINDPLVPGSADRSK